MSISHTSSAAQILMKNVLWRRIRIDQTLSVKLGSTWAA